jgi:uncharacterized protein
VPAPLLALPFGLAMGLSLGLVGGGGSILAVPVLVYVLGEGVREATTASLLIVGMTALGGALDHARAGRVRFRTAVAFGSSGALGSLAGTLLNRVASPRAILFLFGLLLLAAAGAMLRRPEPRDRLHEGRAHSWMRVLPLGFVVGVLTGFFRRRRGVLDRAGASDRPRPADGDCDRHVAARDLDRQRRRFRSSPRHRHD